MNWSDLPSLNSLRAFAVVAETGSFTKAGHSLNVTQAAVSQQVKSLETWLGTSLVDRSGRGIVLTADGIRLARGLETGFATIWKSIEELSGADALRPVQITTSPAFAAEWLLPRIQEFQLLHPDITLMLNPSVEIMELKPGGIDLAIRYQDRRARMRDETPFLVFDTAVVGTPDLLAGKARTKPEALLDVPWLEELGRNDVSDWFERHGITWDRTPTITRMPGNLIMQAVRRGAGVTHTVKDYFTDDIRSGTVVAAHPEPAFAVFYVLTAQDVVRPAVTTFLKWLSQRAAAEKEA